jgi:hypothetical protein
MGYVQNLNPLPGDDDSNGRVQIDIPDETTETGWKSYYYLPSGSSLGFTPENVANKENTTLDTSTTKYPTNRLVYENLYSFLTIQIGTVNVTTSGWSLVDGFYEKSISESNIHEGNFVDIIPHNSAIDIIQDAELCPRTESSEGTVKIFAKNIPAATFAVTLIITK